MSKLNSYKKANNFFYSERKNMSATIHDVALLAGVSTATVSRVLNNSDFVQDLTRQKVMDAVQKIGYRPNHMARGLMKSRTNSVGILLTYVLNPYHMEIVNAIEKSLFEEGIFCYLCNSGNDEALEANYAEELIHRRVDALIIIEGTLSNTSTSDAYEHLSQRVPLILVNEHIAQHTQSHIVRCEQETGILQALSLFYKQGRSALQLVNGNNHYSFKLKENMFLDFINSHNYDPQHNRIYNIEDVNHPDAARAAGLCIDSILSSNIPVDAILAGNDLLAAGVLQTLMARSVRVPEDIAVIGVDNIIFSQVHRLKLSTIDLRMNSLGQTVAELFIRIANRSTIKPERITIQSQLIERETT
jgi:LacI family transcriptional regulator